MNSSTGFKKRSLLRPPSGMLSSQRQFLKSIDISQSEPILASNIRSQVAAIQEQINLLDNDKRIRTGEASLQKGYILSMKKWLHGSQAMIEKEDDDVRVMKHMGVDSYESGFRKMWKLLSHLDLIVSKMTQLQIIYFIKYDDLFLELTQDSPLSTKILQKIAKTGFNPSNFHPSQLILDRSQQMFSVTSKQKRQESGVSSSKGFLKQTRDDTNQLIEQLRQENTKLVSLLEEMESNSKRTEQNKPEPQKIPNSPESIFAAVEQKYKEQLNTLNEKIHGLNHQLAEMKIQCQSVEVKYKAAQLQIKDLKGDGVPKQKVERGSYEQALLQEMNKMKSGFERKIERMVEEYNSRQRQMRKKQYQYKAENDRIKWQKGLLLKKFQTLSA